MSFAAKSAYFVRSAWGSMVRSPFVHLIAIASLCLALVGYGAARVASSQLEALIASLGGDVELTIYLAPSAEPAQVDELEKALAARTSGQVTRVSPAEALGRLAAQLGDQGRALESLSENPLPWTLEVRLPQAAREPSALAELAKKLRELPFVASVDYGEEALERLGLIAKAFRSGTLVIFGLVFLTTIIIVSATLQLAIFSRREEIEIQKLVGATDRFVRVPFLIEGVTQGLVASIVALALMYAAVRYLDSDRGQKLIGFVRLGDHLRIDWLRMAGEQLAAGVGLGLLGSFVAVRRFLRV